MVGGEEMFEEKEGKKKIDKDTVEIKIRFSRFWLERAIYIVIILILIGLLFYNPFGSFVCEKKTTEVTSTPIVSEPEEQETEPEIEEEPVVETEPEPEPEPELSGEVGIIIGDIKLDENKTKIDSILVTIKNDKGLFTPYLKIYWYGPSATDAVKQHSKYEYQFTSLISPGSTNKKIDTEIDRKGGRKLTGRQLNLDPDDRKVTFKIELYDSNENKTILDTKIKSILVS